MPEELLHEREYTRTGIAPQGSRLLQEMASMADSAHEEEAAVSKQGSDAELGRSGAQNGHAHSGDVVGPLASRLLGQTCYYGGTHRLHVFASNSCRCPFASSGAKRTLLPAAVDSRGHQMFCFP